jgi:hypothetical protein
MQPLRRRPENQGGNTERYRCRLIQNRGKKNQQIKQKDARLLDRLDTKLLSNAEKEETVQNCGAATVVAYYSGAPACTCLSLSLSG